MVCVPLFMIISGYLYVGKVIPISKVTMITHLSKLWHVVFTYLIMGVLAFLFRKFYLYEEVSFFKDCILSILRYDKYSWYINMYIGMFLLIPFLNILWHGIPNKDPRRCLVVVLVVLTVLPSILNVYNLTDTEYLLKPWLTSSYSQVVPDWWTNLYPLTYYYIGAYLKDEVDIKACNTTRLVFLLLGAVVVFGLYNIYRSYSVSFIKGPWCHHWGSFQNMAMSILVFLIINSVTYPTWLRNAKLIPQISALTFGAYLMSWIPDNVFYPMLNEQVGKTQLRFNYFPVMVVLVAVSALLLSWIADRITKTVQRVFRKA